MSQEQNHFARLGYTVDLSFLMDQTEESLEALVGYVHASMTSTCRTASPKEMLHELYDIWCRAFLETSGASEDHDELAFPQTPQEIIARCLACVDSYKMIYTRLYEYYNRGGKLNQHDKKAILNQCHELVQRMHLVCRGFACFA